jgi:menaquinone-dependent protoporphyrinogen oxidase
MIWPAGRQQGRTSQGRTRVGLCRRAPDAQAAGMRILVVYGSKMGGTASLAATIGEALRRDGVPAQVRPADAVGSVEGYDVVIVGGALYHGRWRCAARRFVRRHRAALRSMPVWFFSSGPLGYDQQSPQIRPVGGVRRLMRRVGARGHATFGGRLLTNPARPGHRVPARSLAGRLAQSGRGGAVGGRHCDPDDRLQRSHCLTVGLSP